MLADFKPLIKNRNFVYLWISQVLSQLTINIINFLLLVKLYTETGSAIATSLLWVSYALPAIIVGPIAAASVDMVERKKLLVVTNLCQAATIFFYAQSHMTSLFLLFGVVMTYSFLNQFYVPAEFATLPSIVVKKRLAHANGLFFMTQTASLIVGFSLAGILKQFLGFTTTLYLCASFLFIAFISVSFLPSQKCFEVIPKKFEQAFISFFKRIMEGYRYIKERKSVFFPFLLLMVLQVSIAIVVINIPVFAQDVLKIPLESAGHILGIPIGLGAAIAAISIPKLLRAGLRKKSVIESSLIALTFFLFITSILVPGFGTKIRLTLGMVCLFAIGYSFVGTIIPTQTFLQEITPGGLRGRVFGNYWFLVTIATIFPVIFSGTITEILGIRFLLILLAGLALTISGFSKKYGQKFVLNSFKQK